MFPEGKRWILWGILVFAVLFLSGCGMMGSEPNFVPLEQDASGTLSLVYKIDRDHLPANSSHSQVMDNVEEIMSDRLWMVGVSDANFQRTESGRVRVELPGVKDKERAELLVGSTGKLEFRAVAEDVKRDTESGELPDGYEEIHYGDQAQKRFQGQPIIADQKAELTGRQLDDVQVVEGRRGNYSVLITFTEDGTKQFGDLTTENAGGRIAIVVDEEVISAPHVNEPIHGGQAQISGRFSRKEASDLAVILNSDVYPVPLQKVEGQDKR